MSEAVFQWRTRVQWFGLCAGPVVAAIAYASLPTEYVDEAGKLVAFAPAGRLTLSIMLWMAIWWITEAVDISVTALLPLVLFPLTGVALIE